MAVLRSYTKTGGREEAASLKLAGLDPEHLRWPPWASTYLQERKIRQVGLKIVDFVWTLILPCIRPLPVPVGWLAGPAEARQLGRTPSHQATPQTAPQLASCRPGEAPKFQAWGVLQQLTSGRHSKFPRWPSCDFSVSLVRKRVLAPDSSRGASNRRSRKPGIPLPPPNLSEMGV